MHCSSDDQYAIDERARIMEFDGKVPRSLAERWARERPWEKDPRWKLPPAQMTLDGTPAGEALQFVMNL